MATLTKQAIFDADDQARLLVKCPEWGGEVWVHAVRADDMFAWELAKYSDAPDVRKRAMASLIAVCARDDNGDRLFSEADVERLAGKSAKPIYRLYRVAEKLNGLLPSDLDEIVKNSQAVPTSAAS